MKVIPAIICAILIVGLFFVEPLADKKGFGKLVVVIRIAIILGVIAGYALYFLLRSRQ